MSEGPQWRNLRQSFETFFESWIFRQQTLLDKLLRCSVQSDSPAVIEQQNALIGEVLSHYQRYLEEKSRLANADVFLLFSPTWLSSYERALLWLSDYKPSLLLRLVDGAVKGLTEDQKRSLEQAASRTRREERQLSGAMANVQESVAGPSALHVIRREGRLLDGEISSEESEMEALQRAMVEVLRKADELRVSTVSSIAGILRPPQLLQFLAAAAQFQLRLRRLGWQRDAQTGAPSE